MASLGTLFRRVAGRARVGVFLLLLCALAAQPVHASLLVNLGYSYLRLLEAGKVVHHELHVALEPDAYTAHFTDDVTVRLTKSTSTLYMSLGVDFSLDRVSTLEGEPLEVRPYISLGALPFVIYRIDLPRRVANGAETTLRFEYHISPDTAELFFPYLSRELFFATIAMFWYPQMPTEGYFSARIHLDKAPSTWRMVADGVPLDGTVGRSWSTVKELPGLGFVAGNFIATHQEVAGRDVYSWYLAGYQPGVSATMGLRAGQALALFERWLGELPLQRLDIAALPYGLGGSTGQYAWFVYDEMNVEVNLQNDRLVTYLAAHETAHKWIGFTAGTQLLGTTWITEGLTDYLAFLAVEQIHGVEGMREVIEIRAIQPLAEDPGRKRALTAINVHDDDVKVAFQKGALVFRMLHRRLGDEGFFQLLRTFTEEYRHGNATSRDFTGLIERVGGSSMRRFVSDWIEGTQELDYALTGVQVTPEGAGERLTFQVNSVGRLSEPGPVEVAVVLSDGSEHVVTVELGRRESFSFPHAIRHVVVDPNYWTADWRRENNVWSAE